MSSDGSRPRGAGMVVTAVLGLGLVICATVLVVVWVSSSRRATVIEGELADVRQELSATRESAASASAELEKAYEGIASAKSQLQKANERALAAEDRYDELVGNAAERESEARREGTMRSDADVESLRKQVSDLTEELEAEKLRADRAEAGSGGASSGGSSSGPSGGDMQLDPTITAHEVTVDGHTWQYWLYRARPRAYNQQMVLSLHGSGESGSGLTALEGTSSLSRWILDGTLTPDCIVVMPQCPDFGWDTEGLKALVDHVCDICHADRSRLSVTGVSMGGFGTWSLLESYPDMFWAAAPIASNAGDLDALRSCKARVLAMSGTADGYDAQAGVDAIVAGGGTAEHVWVDGAGHSDMCNIYGDESQTPLPFLLGEDGPHSTRRA